MDAEAKKTVLRMIPYGLYVLTAKSGSGKVAAATVNWVTQVSFEPPLVVVGVKADSKAHGVIREARTFALNVLGKDQAAVAFAFFKPVEPEGETIGGQAFTSGNTGSPVLKSCPGYLECELVETVERGDHSVIVGQVVNAGLQRAPAGRADEATLMLKDLGERVFYGG